MPNSENSATRVVLRTTMVAIAGYLAAARFHAPQNGAALAVCCLLDHFWYYPRESKADIAREETRIHPLRFRGVWPNGLFLLPLFALTNWIFLM